MSAPVRVVPKFTECWLEKPPRRPSLLAIGLKSKSKWPRARLALRPREYEKFCPYHQRTEKLDDILPQFLEKGSLHLRQTEAQITSKAICEVYQRWIGPFKRLADIADLVRMLKEGGVPLHNQADLDFYRNPKQFGHVDRKAAQAWMLDSKTTAIRSTIKKYDPSIKKRNNPYSPLTRIPQFRHFLSDACKIISKCYGRMHEKDRRMKIRKSVSEIANRTLYPNIVLAYPKRIRSPLDRFISPEDLSGLW